MSCAPLENERSTKSIQRVRRTFIEVVRFVASVVVHLADGL